MAVKSPDQYQPEKQKAVQRYVKQNADVHTAVLAGAITSMAENPYLLARPTIKVAGLPFGATLYKLGLYERGVTPIDIQRNVEAMKGKERGRKELTELVQTVAAVCPRSAELMGRVDLNNNGPDAEEIILREIPRP